MPLKGAPMLTEIISQTGLMCVMNPNKLDSAGGCIAGLSAMHPAHIKLRSN